MKIAIICYYHVDATISLAKYLKQIDKNIQIDFICLFSQSDKNSTPISFNDFKVDNGFQKQEVINQIIDKEVRDYLYEYAKLRVFVFNSWKKFDYKNFIQLIQLSKQINNTRYDVINFVGNSMLVTLLNKLTINGRKFHTIHETYPHNNISKKNLFMFNLQIKLLLGTKSNIIIPSLISYQRFTSHWKVESSKLSLIKFGVLEIYLEYIKTKNKKSSDTILFFGIINPYKGVEVLIDAMKEVIKVHPKAILIVAGKGKLDTDIKELGDNLIFINRYITNEEIAELNQKASIVVCPYLSASQSGVVMTSFAFNNPIIATKVGGLAEVIEDGITGVMINESNVSELKNAIIDLIDHPDRVAKLRSNINEKYINSEYGWLQIANQYYELFNTN